MDKKISDLIGDAWKMKQTFQDTIYKFKDETLGGLIVRKSDIARIIKVTVGPKPDDPGKIVKYGVQFRFKSGPEFPYTLIYLTAKNRDMVFNDLYKDIFQMNGENQGQKKAKK